MDARILDILACPDTHHAPLAYDAGEQTLTCTECGRIFEIRDGIPVLLLDEARPGSGPAAGSAGAAEAAGSADPTGSAVTAGEGE